MRWDYQDTNDEAVAEHEAQISAVSADLIAAADLAVSLTDRVTVLEASLASAMSEIEALSSAQAPLTKRVTDLEYKLGLLTRFIAEQGFELPEKLLEGL